jgi:hypothetical protein
MRIRGYGIEIDLPTGWEGMVYRRPQAYPILHAGDFPLPPNDGDFGLEAITTMRPDGAFVVLAEYDPAVGGRGLFWRADTPWPLRESSPRPRSMQRPRTGRAGVQRFFTANGRAFCLYLVVGTASGTSGPVRRANSVLATVKIAPRDGAESRPESR